MTDDGTSSNCVGRSQDGPKTKSTVGAAVQRELADVGGGNLIASLVDASGSIIGLSQPAK